MHSFILPAIVTAASFLLQGVQADTYPGLPACAQTCAVGPIQSKCGALTRDFCTCFESGLPLIIQCISSACSCSDSTIAVGVFQTVCAPQGLPVYGVPCTTSSSNSSSTPITPTPPFGGGNATVVLPSGSGVGGAGGAGGKTTSTPAKGSPTASPTGPSTASPSPFKGAAAAVVQAGWFAGVVAAAGFVAGL